MIGRTTLLLALAALAGCAHAPQPLSAHKAGHAAVLADPSDRLYRSVAVVVEGRPSFVLVDAERSEARDGMSRDAFARRLSNWLADAQMLAGAPADARFLLTVDFAPEAAARLRIADDRFGTAPRYVLREVATSAIVFDSASLPADDSRYAVDLAFAKPGDAVDLLPRLSFARVLSGLADARLVLERRAVPCGHLNPTRSEAILVSTPKLVGIDCPRPAAS